jgi:hypothetical protein
MINLLDLTTIIGFSIVLFFLNPGNGWPWAEVYSRHYLTYVKWSWLNFIYILHYICKVLAQILMHAPAQPWLELCNLALFVVSAACLCFIMPRLHQNHIGACLLWSELCILCWVVLTSHQCSHVFPNCIVSCTYHQMWILKNRGAKNGKDAKEIIWKKQEARNPKWCGQKDGGTWRVSVVG